MYGMTAILIIDDEAGALLLLQRQLETGSCAVKSAEGMVALQRDKFH